MDAVDAFVAAAPTIPPVFQNCKDFQEGKDEKYAACELAYTDDPCYLLTEMHRAKEYRTFFLAIIPVVLSVLAFILNAIFLVLQSIAWKRAGSGHRKRYVFLLFRSVTSLLTLLLFYILLICWKEGGFQYYTVAIFLFIGAHDFLAIAGTYLALTCMLYTAVMHPFFYRLSIRFYHTLLAVGGIWLLSIAISVLVGIYGATLFYPDSAPVACSFDACRLPLSVCIVIILAAGILTVIGLYAALLFQMRRRLPKRADGSRKSTTSISSHQSSYVAMNRLAFNMGSFALASLPLLIVAVLALVQLRDLATLGEGVKSPCKTFLNGPLFIKVELLASAAALIWVISMLLDPIINILADPRLFEMVKSVLRRTPCGKRLAEKAAAAEEDSSE